MADQKVERDLPAELQTHFRHLGSPKSILVRKTKLFDLRWYIFTYLLDTISPRVCLRSP